MLPKFLWHPSVLLLGVILANVDTGPTPVGLWLPDHMLSSLSLWGISDTDNWSLLPEQSEDAGTD